MNHSRIVEGRHGRFLYNPNDLYIGRSLERYGEYSEREVAFLSTLVRPGMMVVDAGANIGALTVPLARRVGPSGTVIAFEPQRLVFQMLCANLALNSLSNVHAHLAALGATSGVVAVPELQPDRPQNFGGVSLLERWPRAQRVPCRRLDELEIPRVDLLKADVEGMEPEVVRGARETIGRSSPILYLEADRENRRGDLFAELQAVDYVAFWHCPPLYNTHNHAGNADNEFGDIVSMNWLCVHRSRAGAIQGLERVEGAASRP